MPTMTEQEIDQALVEGMRERITLRQKALEALYKKEEQLHSEIRKLLLEIKKIKDFIEER